MSNQSLHEILLAHVCHFIYFIIYFYNTLYSADVIEVRNDNITNHDIQVINSFMFLPRLNV